MVISIGLKCADFPMFIAIEDKILPCVIIINESKESELNLISNAVSQ